MPGDGECPHQGSIYARRNMQVKRRLPTEVALERHIADLSLMAITYGALMTHKPARVHDEERSSSCRFAMVCNQPAGIAFRLDSHKGSPASLD
eukprot:6126793-Amphidinium_carterae.1